MIIHLLVVDVRRQSLLHCGHLRTLVNCLLELQIFSIDIIVVSLARLESFVVAHRVFCVLLLQNLSIAVVVVFLQLFAIGFSGVIFERNFHLLIKLQVLSRLLLVAFVLGLQALARSDFFALLRHDLGAFLVLLYNLIWLRSNSILMLQVELLGASVSRRLVLS